MGDSPDFISDIHGLSLVGCVMGPVMRMQYKLKV
jgi:hypothetical protein